MIIEHGSLNALRHQYTPTEKVHVIAGKKPNEILERVCHTLFRLSEHPVKISNNKKILHTILKNGFRLLLRVYGLLNIQKG